MAPRAKRILSLAGARCSLGARCAGLAIMTERPVPLGRGPAAAYPGRGRGDRQPGAMQNDGLQCRNLLHAGFAALNLGLGRPERWFARTKSASREAYSSGALRLV